MAVDAHRARSPGPRLQPDDLVQATQRMLQRWADYLDALRDGVVAPAEEDGGGMMPAGPDDPCEDDEIDEEALSFGYIPVDQLHRVRVRLAHSPRTGVPAPRQGRRPPDDIQDREELIPTVRVGLGRLDEYTRGL